MFSQEDYLKASCDLTICSVKAFSLLSATGGGGGTLRAWEFN